MENVSGPPGSGPAGDVFRAFVEELAASLVDAPVPATEISRRLHLSRFHVDRLVSAVSGETPTALCRRVLLERAALALRTSSSPVVDVAVHAGYDSHEGFTRAFGKAFGVPPSVFRDGTGDWRLGRVDSVHFHPPGGLRLPPTRKERPVNLVTTIVEHHVWLVGQMLDRAAGLPDDVLDRPVEMSVEGVDDQPTLRSLLARLVGQMAMWELAEDGVGDYDLAAERGMTVADIRSSYDRVGPAFVALAHRVEDGGLTDETFVNTMCQPPEVFTYGGLLAHVITFAAHRRTLVCGALWSAGVTDLGSGDPREWVSARS